MTKNKTIEVNKAIEVIEYIEANKGLNFGVYKIALDMAIDALKRQNLKSGTRVKVHGFKQQGTILSSGEFRGKFAYGVLLDGDPDCMVFYSDDVEEIDE